MCRTPLLVLEYATSVHAKETRLKSTKILHQCIGSTLNKILETSIFARYLGLISLISLLSQFFIFYITYNPFQHAIFITFERGRNADRQSI